MKIADIWEEKMNDIKDDEQVLIDKTLQLKVNYFFKNYKEKEIEKKSKEYDQQKKEMLELMELKGKKTFAHGMMVIKARTVKSPKVTDLATFMRWVCNNCTKEEYESLFTPKVKALSDFVTERFDQLKGIENVLFEIPGIKIKSEHTTISVKERKKNEKR